MTSTYVVGLNRRLMDNHDSANFTVRSSETQYTYGYWLDGGKRAVRPQGKQLVTGHAHFTVAGLREGPHVLLVRATDVTGAEDPTPATYKWTVRACAGAEAVGSEVTSPRVYVPSDPTQWWTPGKAASRLSTRRSRMVVLTGGAVSPCCRVTCEFETKKSFQAESSALTVRWDGMGCDAICAGRLDPSHAADTGEAQSGDGAKGRHVRCEREQAQRAG